MIAKDVVAIVSGGAGANLGSELSRGLSALGARVVVADVDEEGARKLADEIGGHWVRADLTSEDSVREAVAKVRAEVGPIGILVNSAGGYGAGPDDMVNVSRDSLASTLELNVGGTFLMTQHVARQMIADEVAGAIVSISTSGSLRPAVGWSHYLASKAAINAFTAAAALELGPEGIRVNAVAPGPIMPAGMDMSEVEMSDPEMSGESMPERFDTPGIKDIPLRAYTGTDDVLAAVAFLAGDGAKNITGVVLPLEGGWLLS